MKYSRAQDVAVIRSAIKTGRPSRRRLAHRIAKKYGFTGISVILEAFYDKKKERKQ
jgi:hypothetical protein